MLQYVLDESKRPHTSLPTQIRTSHAVVDHQTYLPPNHPACCTLETTSACVFIPCLFVCDAMFVVQGSARSLLTILCLLFATLSKSSRSWSNPVRSPSFFTMPRSRTELPRPRRTGKHDTLKRISQFHPFTTPILLSRCELLYYVCRIGSQLGRAAFFWRFLVPANFFVSGRRFSSDYEPPVDTNLQW